MMGQKKQLIAVLILGALMAGCSDTPNFGVDRKSQVVAKKISRLNAREGSAIYALNWSSGRATSFFARPTFRADIDFADVGDYIICSNGVIIAVKSLPND